MKQSDSFEHAIENWKRSLRGHAGLEPGTVAELEDHVRIRGQELIDQGHTPQQAVARAARELGSTAAISRDYARTDRLPVARLVDLLIKHLPLMSGHYLKTAYRHLKRNPLHTFINVIGLSVSLAVCVMILMFVLFHLSFDHFHEDKDRIFLVRGKRTTERGVQVFYSNLTHTGAAIRDRFPQAESVARSCAFWNASIRKDGIDYPESAVRYVEADLFAMFNFNFLEGNPDQPYTGPDSIVISRSLADKHIGAGPVLGKQILMSERLYTVSAVVDDLPRNTILQDAIFVPWENTQEHEMLRTWDFAIMATSTYVKLKPRTNPDDFAESIRLLAHEYIADQLSDVGMKMENVLQPLTDLNLHQYEMDQLIPTRNLIYVWIFSAAGLLILLIACLNYINLSTARAIRRAAEIGLRKVSGATRPQLMVQFLGESIGTVILAAMFSVLLIEFSLPLFNRLAGVSFTIGAFVTPAAIAGAIILVLTVGLIGGIYPAVVLSSFKPETALRGTRTSGTGGSRLRTLLVVVQFSASVFLIIATATVYRQLHYMTTVPLGFNKENKIVLRLKSWDRLPGEKVETVRTAFQTVPGVREVTTGSGAPGISINRLWLYPSESDPDNGLAVRCLRCDRSFPELFDIPVLASIPDLFTRSWDAVRGNFLINETAMRQFGWNSPQEAVGQTILIGDSRTPLQVLGVLKDFHWYGLQQELEPMVIRLVHMARYITLHVDDPSDPETMAGIQDMYKQWFPGDLFDYVHVEDNFMEQYQFEEKIGTVFLLFSGIGILIACMGLLGMASHMAEQRTKEIGIRKVMGATVFQITSKLTWEFVRWVILAGILSWPFTYLAVDWWLSDFAYRVNQHWLLYVGATAAALIIAMVTVAGQSIRCATTNPVHSLKYE